MRNSHSQMVSGCIPQCHKALITRTFLMIFTNLEAWCLKYMSAARDSSLHQFTRQDLRLVMWLLCRVRAHALPGRVRQGEARGQDRTSGGKDTGQPTLYSTNTQDTFIRYTMFHVMLIIYPAPCCELYKRDLSYSSRYSFRKIMCFQEN